MDSDYLKQFLREIAPEARSSFAQIVGQDPVGRTRLRVEIQDYIELIKAFAADGSDVDQESARKIARGLIALLGSLTPDTPDDHRRLVQAACRYFVLDEDGDDDFDTGSGFDDDTDVFNAVAEEVGRSDLVIDWF